MAMQNAAVAPSIRRNVSTFNRLVSTFSLKVATNRLNVDMFRLKVDTFAVRSFPVDRVLRGGHEDGFTPAQALK
jgi:hypothetical protein